MANPFSGSEIVAIARKNPMLLAAGLGAVGIAAFLTTRGGGSTDAPPSATDTTGAQATPPAASSDLMGADSGSPYAGPPGGGYVDPSTLGLGFDPFGGAGTNPYGGQPTDPGVTTDGCSWPPPAIPAGYEGRGSWSCVQAQWTWNWITPPTPGPGPGGTNAKGCPLPKPTLAPALIGKYRYECHNKRWVLVAVTGNPPPPTPTPSPNVSKGRHTTYAGHRNARRVLVLSDPRTITLAKAEHWTLSPAESGDRTPGKRGGAVRVRQVKAAHGHAGLIGRWLA